MKNQGLLFLFLLFFSCQTKKENPILKNLRKWEIKLKDDYGTLSILLPKEFDTSFEWIHHTDYTRGAEYKFRAQPKDYPVYMESGFFWNDLKDTVDQFTIAYAVYRDYDSTFVYKPDQYFRDQLLGEAKIFKRKYHWIDTIRSADQQLMLAYSFDETEKIGVRFQGLICETYQKGDRITIEFVSKIKRNDADSNFSKKCLESIKSIKFHL